MVDASEKIREGKNYGVGVPVPNPVYELKGANNYDWGMKDRLSRIFQPKTSRAVMLAFDHGYLMGPTSGLERVDITILPIAEHVDCLMCTRGVLRACIPPTYNKPIALRCSSGSTILTELNDELIAVDIEDAIRLNASMMAAMVAIGSEYEAQTVKNVSKLINTGLRYGIPTLGVTAVGKNLVRDARYLTMAARVIAELGAHAVKSYYCEPGFEEMASACPVPIVIAGGKKIPELDALTMAYKAIDQGASGVDMGRNVFQSDDPVAMMHAVRAVVHEGAKPEAALDIYNTMKSENEKK
ncbi:MAG: 3-hydroxy-5-phosphonooxypentane-2,4-dione thiolase [Planctomycetota bacterium]|jgi:putative autoinducer-2 (AI-2) aldolase